jgi:hypothetical protein
VVEGPVLTAQHQSGRGGTADVGGVPGDRVEELDEVEVGDQRVSHFDEDVGEVLDFQRHVQPLFLAYILCPARRPAAEVMLGPRRAARGRR